MTKTRKDLLRRYRAVNDGPRAGNEQAWTVTRIEDQAETRVITHAMAGPASAIEKAIRRDEWATVPKAETPAN